MHHRCFLSGLPEDDGRVRSPSAASFQVSVKADHPSPFALVRAKMSSEFGKEFPGQGEEARMKRERGPRERQPRMEGDAAEMPLDQGVNGIAQDMRVDLRDAVSGEYRFQGSLIRAFYIAGQTWFVAAEVCEALDIANPSDAASALDPDEKGIGIADTLGGPQSVKLISESAIYALVFRSRKPQAKAFRRWVTGEVLPEIRQTGAYSTRGQLGGDGSIVLPQPDKPTRFIVTAAPGDAPHIRRTTLDEAVAEFTGLDRQAMCYTLKQIEVWWSKVQIKDSVRVTHDAGFAIHKLDEAIRNGSEMADHFLHVPS
jgi:hypothetical protein